MAGEKLTEADWRFLERAEEFKDLRWCLYDCPRTHVMSLPARERAQIRDVAYQLWLEIRRRRPDLVIDALAKLASLDFDNPPSDDERLQLVTDAEDVIGETAHALTTGKVGEYIEAAAPRLRRPDAAPPKPAPPLEPPAAPPPPRRDMYVCASEGEMLQKLGYGLRYPKKLKWLRDDKGWIDYGRSPDGKEFLLTVFNPRAYKNRQWPGENPAKIQRIGENPAKS